MFSPENKGIWVRIPSHQFHHDVRRYHRGTYMVIIQRKFLFHVGAVPVCLVFNTLKFALKILNVSLLDI